MRAVTLAFLLVGTALASAGLAAADHCWAEIPPCDYYPGDTFGPNPLCEPVPGPFTCHWPWFKADLRGGKECVAEQGLGPCLETTCTLDEPPSRCGNAFVAAGFRA